jgi:RNA recognition motif. (a.k.a. RRM, RBD, or RNP domain)
MDHHSTSRGLLKTSKKPITSTSSEPTRLFVGGLVPEVTESQLYNYFRKFGVLTECEIPKTIRGKKKRFGYISFARDRDARAVLQLEHHLVLGSPVQVELALSTLEIFHEQLRKSKCKLFVSGDLIALADPNNIFEELSNYGEVEKVKKLRTDKKSFNSCFVTMKSIADAEYLLEQKSLVLPTLQKVTFKRFVPRGRTDDGDEEQLELGGLEVISIENNNSTYYKDADDSKTATLLNEFAPFKNKNTRVAEGDCIRDSNIIHMREGLFIRKGHDLNGQMVTKQNYHSSHGWRSARLISLEIINLQSIQDVENNLRYNLSARNAYSTYKGIVLHC